MQVSDDIPRSPALEGRRTPPISRLERFEKRAELVDFLAQRQRFSDHGNLLYKAVR